MRRLAVTALLATVAAIGVVGLAAPASADPAPDLGVSFQSFGGDGTVARGGAVGVAFQLTGSAPDASLTLTVPTGGSLRSADADNGATVLTCSGTTGTVTCPIAVDGSALVNVALDVAADARIGAAFDVVAAISSPAGADEDPTNDSATAPLTVVGNATLSHRATPGRLTVPVGGSATVTFTVANAGPDAATHVVMGFLVQSNDATPPTLTGFSAPVDATTHGGATWHAGTIPAGGSVSLTVTVSAAGPVTDSELSYATSADGIGQVCDNAACLDGVDIVSAAASTSPPPAATTSDAATAGPELAATGSPDGGLGLLGAVCVLVGVGVLVTARRRTRHGH